MLLCDAPELVRWRPDFSSSGQPEPEWTRVRCAGEEVANALEWIEWDERPVQVVLCEQCGVTGCAVGGRAHVTRLGEYVLWTVPEPGDGELDEREHQPTVLLRRHGALAIPVDVWSRWPGVPTALEPTRRRDLHAAWQASAPPRADAFATDLGALDDAFAAVEAAERWFAADPDAEVEGLVPLGEGGVTIFYDSPRFTEWTPVALVGDGVTPVLGSRFTVGVTSSGSG
ncbi:hypothetical protein OJ997_35415 [Solirubrobacter phytolaccae]|uniref:Uncharacterized protein n=1 Tax=Solirubrobacter phytolaccae TaxID=1404360 RepID=A0A9X3NHY6_9ACTN|nr:hypothetical protein [Solirubrobacter phytolaccae]MDA0185649.1 hypothetical protein [Solirubrobacter phytolaccae]